MEKYIKQPVEDIRNAHRQLTKEEVEKAETIDVIFRFIYLFLTLLSTGVMLICPPIPLGLYVGRK